MVQIARHVVPAALWRPHPADPAGKCEGFAATEARMADPASGGQRCQKTGRVVAKRIKDDTANRGHQQECLCYWSLAYSDLAASRMGMSGSASFQRVRKSW